MPAFSYSCLQDLHASRPKFKCRHYKDLPDSIAKCEPRVSRNMDKSKNAWLVHSTEILGSHKHKRSGVVDSLHPLNTFWEVTKIYKGENETKRYSKQQNKKVLNKTDKHAKNGDTLIFYSPLNSRY